MPLFMRSIEVGRKFLHALQAKHVCLFGMGRPNDSLDSVVAILVSIEVCFILFMQHLVAGLDREDSFGRELPAPFILTWGVTERDLHPICCHLRV